MSLRLVDSFRNVAADEDVSAMQSSGKEIIALYVMPNRDIITIDSLNVRLFSRSNSCQSPSTTTAAAAVAAGEAGTQVRGIFKVDAAVQKRLSQVVMKKFGAVYESPNQMIVASAIAPDGATLFLASAFAIFSVDIASGAVKAAAASPISQLDIEISALSMHPSGEILLVGMFNTCYDVSAVATIDATTLEGAVDTASDNCFESFMGATYNYWLVCGMRGRGTVHAVDAGTAHELSPSAKRLQSFYVVQNGDCRIVCGDSTHRYIATAACRGFLALKVFDLNKKEYSDDGQDDDEADLTEVMAAQCGDGVGHAEVILLAFVSPVHLLACTQEGMLLLFSIPLQRCIFKTQVQPSTSYLTNDLLVVGTTVYYWSFDTVYVFSLEGVL